MTTSIQPAQGKQKKIDQVKALTDKLTKAKALVLTDPQGLTHKQLEDLRKKLKQTQGELTVSKNTLMKRALKEVKQTLSDTLLTGPNATLFVYADEISPLKELVKFLKNAGKGTIKGGLLGAQELTLSDVEKLASLPSRDILLSKLVGQLQAPIYGLHYALSWNIRKLVWALEGVKTQKSV